MLGVLTGLVGRWTVSGHAHSEPVVGTVDATLAVQGSWLVVRETLVDPQGQAVHEDLCLYGQDPLTGDLQVHHFQDGGAVQVHAVLPTDDGQGVHWVPRGGGPRVELRQVGAGWRVAVLGPDPGPAEVVVDYAPTT